MASKLVGFRRNMEQTIPEQIVELRHRIERLTEDLNVSREDEAYLVAIARVAGINLDELHETMGAAVVAEDANA